MTVPTVVPLLALDITLKLWLEITGARLAWVTFTVTVADAFIDGLPLSVTFTVSAKEEADKAAALLTFSTPVDATIEKALPVLPAVMA